MGPCPPASLPCHIGQAPMLWPHHAWAQHRRGVPCRAATIAEKSSGMLKLKRSLKEFGFFCPQGPFQRRGA